MNQSLQTALDFADSLSMTSTKLVLQARAKRLRLKSSGSKDDIALRIAKHIHKVT